MLEWEFQLPSEMALLEVSSLLPVSNWAKCHVLSSSLHSAFRIWVTWRSLQFKGSHIYLHHWQNPRKVMLFSQKCMSEVWFQSELANSSMVSSHMVMMPSRGSSSSSFASTPNLCWLWAAVWGIWLRKIHLVRWLLSPRNVGGKHRQRNSFSILVEIRSGSFKRNFKKWLLNKCCFLHYMVLTGFYFRFQMVKN